MYGVTQLMRSFWVMPLPEAVMPENEPNRPLDERLTRGYPPEGYEVM